MSEARMLTTSDNPYNPFDDWSKWFAYDTSRGYNTCGLIDRLARTSDDFGDEMNSRIIDEAIETIIQINPPGFYVVVTESEKDEDDVVEPVMG